MIRSDRRATAAGADWAIVLGGALVLAAWDASGADLAVMRWVGGAQGFAWRDGFVTATLLHQAGRWLSWAVALGWLVDAVRPFVDGPGRCARWGWLGVVAACSLLVAVLKHHSGTSCPWDLAEFGGRAAHVGHWAWGVADGGPGHCFPSGHASAALSFLPGYFLLRPSRPVLARRWAAGVLVAGAAFGGAQVLRGAHYPSHVLWTAWLCWCVCVAAQRGVDAGAVLARGPAPCPP